MLTRLIVEFLARDISGALPPTVVLEQFTDLLNVPQVLPTSNIRKVSFVISSFRNTSSRTRLYASIDMLLCEERFDRLLEVRIHYRGWNPTLAAKRLHFWFRGLSSMGKLRVFISRSSTTGIPVELDAYRSAVGAHMADSLSNEWDLEDDIGAFMSCFLFAAPHTANL
ncbi:hypothetical protein K474DRAFT_127503 [Panus rudis PR-1116 ss-1]|nr:hypothetical protein K474DRAFT_127503 [Panus rudis PR-1116 ss-1]